MLKSGKRSNLHRNGENNPRVCLVYVAEDVNRPEPVQRRAARFVHDRQAGCVGKIVQALNSESLSSRTRTNRLTMLYKIQRDFVDMDASKVIRP